MRSIRPPFAARRGRGARRGTSPVLAAVGLTAALALTATACNSGDDNADAKSSASASASSDGKIKIPDDLKDKLKE
ncbi:hypothetical protein ACFWER_11255, partial [Streptomyces sp. NPDC060188]